MAGSLLLPCLAATAQAQTSVGTVAAPEPIKKASAPSRTDPRFVWDLPRLYANDAAWDAERSALLAEIPSLATLKGSLNTAAGMKLPCSGGAK